MDTSIVKVVRYRTSSWGYCCLCIEDCQDSTSCPRPFECCQAPMIRSWKHSKWTKHTPPAHGVDPEGISRTSLHIQVLANATYHLSKSDEVPSKPMLQDSTRQASALLIISRIVMICWLGQSVQLSIRPVSCVCLTRRSACETGNVAAARS